AQAVSGWRECACKTPAQSQREQCHQCHQRKRAGADHRHHRAPANPSVIRGTDNTMFLTVSPQTTAILADNHALPAGSRPILRMNTPTSHNPDSESAALAIDWKNSLAAAGPQASQVLADLGDQHAAEL